MRSDPRPPRAPVRGGRTLLGVVTAFATVAAVILVFAGLRLGADDDVLVDVEPVAAPRPSAVAPVSAPSAPAAAPAATTPATADLATADPATTDAATTGPDSSGPAAGGSGDQDDAGAELSPLADLLGPAYSAVPEVIEPRPRPVGLAIDAFDVTGFPVRPVGLAPDGQLEIPDETEIGWYRYGATAGRPGATVLAAHVSWNRTVGPFAQLGSLEPGNRLEVRLDDGTLREYEVFERAIYGKLALPRERIWRNTGPETLVLITCGGDFNPEIRRYRENIVVYAAPAVSTAASTRTG